jgi:hypothetical protein
MTIDKLQLIERQGAKDLIESLQHSLIDNIIYSNASGIDTVAEVLSIDPNYLSIQVRLLLPYYSYDDIVKDIDNNCIGIIRAILIKLRNSLASFEINYNNHREKNGIDRIKNNLKIVNDNGLLYLKNSTTQHKIIFDIVDSSIGFNIQENLHYIHKCRDDTSYHFGFFLEKRSHPLCYCSFSVCDRKYQANALSYVINEDIRPDEIIVLTRSFGFNPLPQNMMSKLFTQSINFIKQQYRSCNNYPKYVITALNPFLGFKGGIFLGSSFEPFATCPMEYWYDEKGLYLNRRQSNDKATLQSFETPPIVWLVRPITKNAIKTLENLSFYYKISRNEYMRG